MTRHLPPHPTRDGRLVDANVHLLDRAVVDRDGVPVLAVDDVELAWPDDGPVHVTGLLLGSGLTARFFGAHQPVHLRLGVSWRHVTDLGAAVHLGVARDSLDATWFEQWLRQHVVARIPGSRHASG
jgi:hypothetical protein